MKKIDFIFVGTSKDPSFRELEKTYHAKITRFADSRVICLRDSPAKEIEVKKKNESEAILTEVKSGDVLIICDESGKSLTSKAFSQKIMTGRMAGKRLVFVVGGAFGMSETFTQKAWFKLKLSDFTLPHELARVVLLEQVYRGLSILAGEQYHHE